MPLLGLIYLYSFNLYWAKKMGLILQLHPNGLTRSRTLNTQNSNRLTILGFFPHIPFRHNSLSTSASALSLSLSLSLSKLFTQSLTFPATLSDEISRKVNPNNFVFFTCTYAYSHSVGARSR